MARRGQKKFDRWQFRFEARVFDVDVYVVRPLSPDRVAEKTRFVAMNEELDLKIENTDIDALRTLTRTTIEERAKTVWSTWILYSVNYSPLKSEYGRRMVGLDIHWRLIERCELGTPKERWRDVTRDGEPRSYGRISIGSPPQGVARRERYEEQDGEFRGVIPHTEGAIAGLVTLATVVGSVYDRLRDVLLPGTNTDPAKWLAAASVSGVPLLPSEGRKEAKR